MTSSNSPISGKSSADLRSVALAPAAALYGLAARMARAAARPVRTALPVVSIGNITWGGTGKTPLAIFAARWFLLQGRSPAVLTRGYGRARGLRVPALVPVHGADASLYGDEPCLMARRLGAVPVLVDASRVRSARAAAEIHHADMVILDDGFQHWAVARDLDVVCVSAADPFGNGRLVPAGILREPPRALARAGLIAITGAPDDPAETGELERYIRAYSTAPVIRPRLRIERWYRCVDGTTVECSEITRSGAAAFSGLGRNEGFLGTLRSAGLQPAVHHCFGDHHRYRLDDLQRIAAGSSDGSVIVCTEKDAVKIEPLLGLLVPAAAARFVAVAVEAYLEQEDLKKWHSIAGSVPRYS